MGLSCIVHSYWEQALKQFGCLKKYLLKWPKIIYLCSSESASFAYFLTHAWACIHVCTYLYTCMLHVRVHAYIYTSVNPRIYIYICTHIYLALYAYMHADVYPRTLAFHLRTCTCVCAFVRVYVCLWAKLTSQWVCVHISACLYIRSDYGWYWCTCIHASTPTVPGRHCVYASVYVCIILCWCSIYL